MTFQRLLLGSILSWAALRSAERGDSGASSLTIFAAGEDF
jgi:hypothetical protein